MDAFSILSSLLEWGMMRAVWFGFILALLGVGGQGFCGLFGFVDILFLGAANFLLAVGKISDK